MPTRITINVIIATITTIAILLPSYALAGGLVSIKGDESVIKFGDGSDGGGGAVGVSLKATGRNLDIVTPATFTVGGQSMPFPGVWPHWSDTADTYDRAAHIRALTAIQQPVSKYATDPLSMDVRTWFTSNTMLNTNAFHGAVYVPRLNRHYMTPRSTVSTSFYVDCGTGTLESFASAGATLLSNSHRYGTYHPLLDRIYYAPWNHQPKTLWYYLDVRTHLHASYTSPSVNTTISNQAYIGGVWHAKLERLYFVPYNQGSSTHWHYIDAVGAVHWYEPLLTSLHNDAIPLRVTGGGAYSPTDDCVYFTPSNGHGHSYYINAVGDVESITSLGGATNFQYIGAIYHAQTNRIFPTPHSAIRETQMAYLDVATRTWIALPNPYKNDFNAAEPYDGGVYSPTRNVIFYVPHNIQQDTVLYMHFIDLNVEPPAIKRLLHRLPTSGGVPGWIKSGNDYSGGSYCPSNDRVYFWPASNSNPADAVRSQNWLFIDGVGAGTSTIPPATYIASNLQGF